MAIVQGPAMSLRASGNMGAICYATWRGTQVARAASTAVCPMTTPQAKAQDAVSEVAAAWSGVLTVTERQRWEEYARNQCFSNRLGLRWVPSGYQVYMKLNVQAVLFGSGVQTLPPLTMKSIMTKAVTMVATTNPGEAKIEMVFEIAPHEPDLMQVFRAGPYSGGGRKARRPDYREIAQVVSPFQLTDSGLDSAAYYWYKVRWGLLNGIVGNIWVEQILTV